MSGTCRRQHRRAQQAGRRTGKGEIVMTNEETAEKLCEILEEQSQRLLALELTLKTANGMAQLAMQQIKAIKECFSNLKGDEL